MYICIYIERDTHRANHSGVFCLGCRSKSQLPSSEHKEMTQVVVILNLRARVQSFIHPAQYL